MECRTAFLGNQCCFAVRREQSVVNYQIAQRTLLGDDSLSPWARVVAKSRFGQRRKTRTAMPRRFVGSSIIARNRGVRQKNLENLYIHFDSLRRCRDNP